MGSHTVLSVSLLFNESCAFAIYLTDLKKTYAQKSLNAYDYHSLSYNWPKVIEIKNPTTRMTSGLRNSGQS